LTATTRWAQEDEKLSFSPVAGQKAAQMAVTLEGGHEVFELTLRIVRCP